ncbi:MAG: hypothetical protein WA996_05555 [Candidatus Promineifilaceae bacterium]
MARDNTRLMAEMSEEYEWHAPNSASLNVQAINYQVDGGSHARFAGDQILDLPHNSLHILVFPLEHDLQLDTPEEACNPALYDLELSEVVLPLAMLLEDVFDIHGLGLTSTAHTSADVHLLGEVVGRVARQIKPIYREIALAISTLRLLFDGVVLELPHLDR